MLLGRTMRGEVIGHGIRRKRGRWITWFVYAAFLHAHLHGIGGDKEQGSVILSSVLQPSSVRLFGVNYLIRDFTAISNLLTGKSAGCPAFLPVGRGGQGGNGLPQWSQSRPCNHIYISPGSPARACLVLTGWARSFTSCRVPHQPCETSSSSVPVWPLPFYPLP